MSGDGWRCLYCNSFNAPSPMKAGKNFSELTVHNGKYSDYYISAVSFVCSNPDCSQISVTVTLFGTNNSKKYDALATVRVLPESSAKPQPDYIPLQIRQDYYEACRIRDLSPKASATLSRRCMQGMIRDFYGISEKTLYLEIDTLKKKAIEGTTMEPITPDVIEAIDHLRNLGNIGAHMEKDIDVIVDVEPGEAQIMIETIEGLFDEWYVARHNRRERFQKLRDIAGEKKEAKKSFSPLALPVPDSK